MRKILALLVVGQPSTVLFLLVLLVGFVGLGADDRILRNALIRPIEPPQYYTCPPAFESAPVLVRDASTVRILPSRPGFLCTLVRVTFAPDDPDGKVGRNVLAPAGRSYNGRDWERVAGPYKGTLKYDCRRNVTALRVCEVSLPPLESDSQDFVLLTYNHTLSKRNTVARFLQQTTFGPTKAEIDSLTEVDDLDLDLSFAKWMQNQIYNVEMTSHREFWRKRIRQRLEVARPIGRPSHPCERSSRWRDVAFTELDVGKIVTMKPLVASAHGDGGQVGNIPYVLYVDGHLRTVVDSFQFVDYGYNVDLSHGYEICEMPESSFEGGGNLILKQPDGSCRKVYGGNMPVKLDDDIIATTPGIVALDLPNLGEDTLFRDDGEGWVLFSELTSTNQEQCQGIPSFGTIASVFGRIRNNGNEKSRYLIHDPYLVVMENTLNSPLEDGGGALVQSTGGTMMCSNAPRTFVNIDYCKLSHDPSTCVSSEADAPSIALTLDRDTILRLSSLSGRYVYFIDGLRDEVGDVLSPCVGGSRSRWVRVEEACDNGPVLHSDTMSILSSLIRSSDDGNPLMRDVFFPEGSEETCDATDASAIGLEISVDGKCWKQVHQDLYSIYDFTYWSGDIAHPGNAIRRQQNQPNPIKAPHDSNSSAALFFPSDHSMDRWAIFKADFIYIGRLGDEIDFRDLTDGLRLSAVAEGFGARLPNAQFSPELVCPSPGEASNEPSRYSVGRAFFDVSLDKESDLYPDKHYIQQRKTTWTTVALTGLDQLRQRVAWALSQILVISPFDIESNRNTEIFLSYYDIFVRNAFRSFTDILREVAYSPMMAESLSYLESKSSAHIWEREKRRIYVEENFAREFLITSYYT